MEKKKVFNYTSTWFKKDIKNVIGLIINISKASGFGISNNGNTACRFFQTAEKTSEINGLKCLFIERLHIILCTVLLRHKVMARLTFAYSLKLCH